MAQSGVPESSGLFAEAQQWAFLLSLALMAWPDWTTTGRSGWLYRVQEEINSELSMCGQ